jgi:hypothetical protein
MWMMVSVSIQVMGADAQMRAVCVPKIVGSIPVER